MGYLTDAALDAGAYGSKLRPIRSNGSYDLSGTGSPEGVVAAPVGCTFTQTDSLTALGGIVVWRKHVGTGTTGWGVVEGDTGTLDVAHLLHPDWALAATLGYLRLRRDGQSVTFAGRLDRAAGTPALASAAPILAGQLPAGFRPRNTYNVRGLCIFGTGTLTGYVSDLGSVGLFNAAFPGAAGSWAVGNRLIFEISYDTEGAWPTVAP